MSRKVTLKVPVDVVVRDRDMHMLNAVNARSRKPGASAEASIRSLANDIDASLDTARRALNSCVEEGFLTMRENRLANGCQVENSYTVTERGMAILGAARSAGLVG